MMRSVLIAAGVVWLVSAAVGLAQTNEAAPGTASQASGLKKTLSDQSFFGTKNVLTLGGDYVNSPKEDFETIGVLTTPLTLDEMHGVVAEVGFGDAVKKGEWQLRFKRKLLTTDTSWTAITDAAHNVTLSDRRSQVLKASYNVKDWWQVGVSGLVEDKVGFDTSSDLISIGPHHGQGLGIQLNTLFKF